jgi:hypothetical protein
LISPMIPFNPRIFKCIIDPLQCGLRAVPARSSVEDESLHEKGTGSGSTNVLRTGTVRAPGQCPNAPTSSAASDDSRSPPPINLTHYQPFPALDRLCMLC